MVKIHSATSINTYRYCPHKYYLRYIVKKKTKPNIYLVRGSAVHEAIARFHGLGIKDFTNLDELEPALFSLFSDAWLQHEDEIEKLGLGKTALNSYYHESLKMLAGWLRRYALQAKKRFAPPRAEVKLFSRTRGVMGIIDAIFNQNGVVQITDYKTSKADTVTDDIKAQMAIYALLYTENFGRLPDIVSIDFLGPQRERCFRVTKRFIEYALELLKEIREKTQSTDEKDYPCTCGGWCKKDFA